MSDIKDKSEEKHSPLPTAIEFLKLHGFDTSHANVELAARMMEAYTDCLKSQLSSLQEENKKLELLSGELAGMARKRDEEKASLQQRVEQLEGENEKLKKQIEEFRVLHGAWRDAIALNPKQ